jgi:ADP-heptose:LPS heptosyltransferase
MKLGVHRLHLALLRRAAPYSGALPRRVRHPNPFAAPWRRAQLDIISHGGVGDVIMCTAVLREVKRRNPGCRIRFYSKYSPLVDGLPYIDAALPRQLCPDRAMQLNYWDDDTDHFPLHGRLIALLGDQMGLKVIDERVECVIDPKLVAGYRAAWQSLPHPRIVLSRHGGAWTPNKEWPEQSWNALIERLTRRATVIEIGATREPAPRVPSGNYLDLRGSTSVSEMAAALAAADLHVGPESGPMHVAAAVRTPSVILYGGYLPTFCTHYPGNIALATELPCAPCWLTRPCPFAQKCMTAITPPMVENSLWRLWSRSEKAPHQRRI